MTTLPADTSTTAQSVPAKTDFPIWKTIKLGEIDNNNSIFQAEIDLVLVDGSLIVRIENGLWEGQKAADDAYSLRVKELGLEFCPPGVATHLMVKGIGKLSLVYIGTVPILQNTADISRKQPCFLRVMKHHRKNLKVDVCQSGVGDMWVFVKPRK